MFYSPFPIIHTRDITRSLRFYKERLGFVEELRDQAGNEPPSYVALRLGDWTVALSVPVFPPFSDRTFELCISAPNTEEAVERLRVAGVPVLVEPALQPYGERNAYVADPDGHVIQIVSSL